MTSHRAFRYALEPLRMKSGWDLDEAKQELTRLGALVNEHQTRVDRLSDAHQGECAALRQGCREMATLSLHTHRLRHAYLARLGEQLHRAHRELEVLAQQRREATQRALQLQRFTDGIERHRQDEHHKHRRAADAVVARDADDAWLARCARGAKA